MRAHGFRNSDVFKGIKAIDLTNGRHSSLLNPVNLRKISASVEFLIKVKFFSVFDLSTFPSIHVWRSAKASC